MASHEKLTHEIAINENCHVLIDLEILVYEDRYSDFHLTLRAVIFGIEQEKMEKNYSYLSNLAYVEQLTIEFCDDVKKIHDNIDKHATQLKIRAVDIFDEIEGSYS